MENGKKEVSLRRFSANQKIAVRGKNKFFDIL